MMARHALQIVDVFLFASRDAFLFILLLIRFTYQFAYPDIVFAVLSLLLLPDRNGAVDAGQRSSQDDGLSPRLGLRLFSFGQQFVLILKQLVSQQSIFLSPRDIEHFGLMLLPFLFNLGNLLRPKNLRPFIFIVEYRCQLYFLSSNGPFFLTPCIIFLMPLDLANLKLRFRLRFGCLCQIQPFNLGISAFFDLIKLSIVYHFYNRIAFLMNSPVTLQPLLINFNLLEDTLPLELSILIKLKPLHLSFQFRLSLQLEPYLCIDLFFFLCINLFLGIQSFNQMLSIFVFLWILIHLRVLQIADWFTGISFDAQFLLSQLSKLILDLTLLVQQYSQLYVVN